MQRYSLGTILPRWFVSKRATARRHEWRRCVIGCACLAVFLAGLRYADAAVLVSGSVTPADIFFTAEDEGLPNDGNEPQTSEPANLQTYFEGRHIANNPNITSDDENENFDVIVGAGSYGALEINTQSQLRDMTLIIGDKKETQITGGGTQIRFGTGVVRIWNRDSTYNNDPDILPANIQAAIDAGVNFRSFKRRIDEPSAKDGFDLYVGKAGTGILQIDSGGRAEIQDAVIVGDEPTGTGTILVDGIGSFLGNNGWAPQGQASDPHCMLIGPVGIGDMTVSNGGTVSSYRFTSAGNDIKYGAVIGSVGAQANGDSAVGGGVGTVTVGTLTSGTAVPTSTWIIGASFQVGGFSYRDRTNPPFSLDFDPEGDQLLYSTSAGRGTLNVRNGGLVNIVDPDQNSQNPDPLYFVNGEFGQVNMSGGAINIGGLPGGSAPLQQGRNYKISTINDGLITGSGTITTGNFLNRYLGQVRVNAGEKLVIDAQADFTFVSASEMANKPAPLTNYGRISVIGTVDSRAELEFRRYSSPPTTTTPAVPIDQPFYNLPLPSTSPIIAPAFEGGQISAQYATLRFHSGIQNRGVMAFTAGTNYVSGQVVNISNEFISSDGTDAGDSTQLLVSGRGTQVVFEDDLATAPGADLNLFDGGKVVVLDQHSFAGGGNIGIELSYSNPSLITVAGDVGIGAGVGINTDLSIVLASDVLHSLKHGDSFEIISFGGDIGGVDLTDPLHPVVDLSTKPLFTDIEVSPDLALFHPELVLNVQFGVEGVYATFLDPSMVGSSGAIGPDFNGDGVVDGQDLIILQNNLGCESGCSVLQGDADGDGDVDGDDFLFWQRNAGRPMPWTGAGSGAAVPEPAGLALLAIGLMSLPAWRRRHAGWFSVSTFVAAIRITWPQVSQASLTIT